MRPRVNHVQIHSWLHESSTAVVMVYIEQFSMIALLLQNVDEVAIAGGIQAGHNCICIANLAITI